MWSKVEDSHASWIPSGIIASANVTDFPAGSLIIYPRVGLNGISTELALRVGPESLVYCLTTVGGGAGNVGDLIDIAGWRIPVFGIDATKFGKPILEFDVSRALAPEPRYDDRRGGFLCVATQGARLLARKKSFDGPFDDEVPIDPSSWEESLIAPSHQRLAWIEHWRLRIPAGPDNALLFDSGVRPM